MGEAEEWDWPPRRKPPSEPVEGRIREERIILPRHVPQRRGNAGAFIKAANAFSGGVFTLFRVVLGAGLAAVIIACALVITIILRT